MLTTRQWISVALNIVGGNLILLWNKMYYFNGSPGEMKFAIGISAVAAVLMFLAFKILRWDASWLSIIPVALIVSLGVPTLYFAAPYFLENPPAALLVGGFMSLMGIVLVLPMFLLNCLLLRWGTRSRRTNR